MVKISVIIPTYNRIQALSETLQSVFQCEEQPEQIIIVDQSENAQENQKKILEQKGNYKGVLEYKIMDTPSSTKARNLGISLVQNEIVVFMDDDIEVLKDTFQQISLLMKEDSIAMIGGINRLACPNGKFFPYIMGTRNWVKRNKGHVTKSMFGRYPTTVNTMVETEWAMGYFFAVRKSCIDRWNLKFDSQLGQYAYAEDLDFSMTYAQCAKKEGLKCILTPSVVVAHLCSTEWRTTSHRMSYVLIFNRYYLINKHGGKWQEKLAFWWSNLFLFFKKIVTKDNPCDFARGMRDCMKYRMDLAQGEMHEELYGNR